MIVKVTGPYVVKIESADAHGTLLRAIVSGVGRRADGSECPFVMWVGESAKRSRITRLARVVKGRLEQKEEA